MKDTRNTIQTGAHDADAHTTAAAAAADDGELMMIIMKKCLVTDRFCQRSLRRSSDACVKDR